MKLPQVQYGEVERLAQGNGQIAQAATENQQQLSLLGKVESTFRDAYAAHAAADTRNKMVDYRAQEEILKKTMTDDANRMIDPQELRAHGIVVDSNEPVKGSVYAAPLFEKKTAALRAQISATVPAMFREKFDAVSEDSAFQSSRDVFNKAMSWRKDEDMADYTDNAHKLTQAEMWNEAHGAAISARDAGTLTNEQLVKETARIEDAKAVAPIVKAILGENQAEIENQISALEDKGYAGTLSETERLRYTRELNVRKRQLESEMDQAMDYNRNLTVGAYEAEIIHGRGSQAVIDQLLKREKIKPEQWKDLTVKLAHKQEENARKNKAVADIQYNIDNNIPSDYHRDQKAIDDYFEKMRQMPGASEANFDRDAIWIAQKTQVLPSEVQSRIVGMNQSNNPEVFARGANLYANLARESPQAVSRIEQKDAIALQAGASMMAAGSTSTEAMAAARAMANRTPEEQEVIKKGYAEAINPKTGMANSAALQKLINSSPLNPYTSFTVNPTIGQQAEFNVNVHALYAMTGDIELARKMAFTSFQKTKTRTEVNGNAQLMDNSPEQMHGMSSKEVQTQKDLYATSLGIPADSLRVTSDALTRTTGTYPVVRIRPDGMIENVYDEQGNPRRFKPDGPLARAQRNDKLRTEADATKKRHDAYYAGEAAKVISNAP